MNGTDKGKPAAAGLAEADATASEDAAATLSLMGIGARPEGLPDAAELELDAARPPSLRFSGGTVLIVGVVVIAAAALYLMRLGQGDLSAAQGATSAEARIEEFLVKLAKPGAMSERDALAPHNLQSLFQDTASIQAIFDRDPTQQQVPVEYVKQNPFVLPLERPTAHAGAAAPAPREDQRLRKLQAEFKDLKLQSVMDGRVKVALINGKPVQVGQQVGSFTVRAIDGRTVELACEEHRFTLSLEDQLRPRR